MPFSICANGGCPSPRPAIPPYLIRRDRRQARPLRDPGESCGPALGIVENATYAARHTAIAIGDVVLLYTDGILEIEGPGREEFGEDRLCACVLRHVDLETGSLLERVLRDAESFGGGHGFDDDVCLMAVDVAQFPG